MIGHANMHDHSILFVVVHNSYTSLSYFYNWVSLKTFIVGKINTKQILLPGISTVIIKFSAGQLTLNIYMRIFVHISRLGMLKSNWHACLQKYKHPIQNHLIILC